MPGKVNDWLKEYRRMVKENPGYAREQMEKRIEEAKAKVDAFKQKKRCRLHCIMYSAERPQFAIEVAVVPGSTAIKEAEKVLGRCGLEWYPLSDPEEV